MIAAVDVNADKRRPPLRGVRLNRRIGLLSIFALAVAGIIASPWIVTHVRARLRPGWIEGKNLTLSPFVKGLTQPTFVGGAPGGSDRLYILERGGLVRIAQGGQLRSTPVLDLSQDVSSVGNEQGLLGLAFDPRFGVNHYVYVDYTANDRSVRVIRYTVSPDDVADPASAYTVLTVPKNSMYHNGGMLAFGPDGYLYIGVGDDEASDRSQDVATLLGKILRLDVESGTPYGTPPSNPFVGREGARAEIWAYGLRNPWRFSFDGPTGDLWIGDVGDATREEVDYQPSASSGGENYGWPIYEGDLCVRPELCTGPGFVAPVVTYGHDTNCAVVGGVVYRGHLAPGLEGTYLYGDLCSGGVFTLHKGVDPTRARLELGYQPIQISSFGEDAAGEVYVCDISGGTIYRIEDGSVPVPANG